MRINLFKQDNVLLWVLLVLVLAFSFVSSEFRRPDNLFEVLRSCSLVALMILGLTWLVASGEIDVSFPNIAAFASIVTAYCIKIGIPWGATVLIAPISAIPLGLLSSVSDQFISVPSSYSDDCSRVGCNIAGQHGEQRPAAVSCAFE